MTHGLSDREAAGELPVDTLFPAAYAAGIYAPQWPAELGGTPPPGGFDAFVRGRDAPRPALAASANVGGWGGH